jgi:arylsulfatase A-like enzyme
MVASHGDLMVGIREGRNKYIVDLWSGEGELYDLDADPREARDLSKVSPELAKQLGRKLAAWVSDNRRVWRQGEVPLRMSP